MASISKNSKKKELAEESQKTKKAREKLRKKLADLSAQVNANALQEKAQEIHHWISRHAKQRVVLKSKTIGLFDENQNAAKLSEKIAKIAEQMQAKQQMASCKDD